MIIVSGTYRIWSSRCKWSKRSGDDSFFDLRYTSEPDQFMLLLNLGSSLRKVGRGQFLLRWKNIYSHNVSFEHARDSQWTSMWEMAMWCSFAIWDVQSAQIMSPPQKKADTDKTDQTDPDFIIKLWRHRQLDSCLSISNCWLVVWNIFYFPIYWVANHPNWLIFFRGVA